MKKKSTFGYIYWVVMPFCIGFFLFYYLNKMDRPFIEKIIIFLVIAIPIATIRFWIGNKLFKEKKTLAEKMMYCGLRSKHGRNYCVECPDGYECAKDLDESDKNVKT